MRNQMGYALASLMVALVWFVVTIGAMIGWVLNIIKLVGMIDGEITTMFVLRVVGIFAAPLGAILGYIG